MSKPATATAAMRDYMRGWRQRRRDAGLPTHTKAPKALPKPPAEFNAKPAMKARVEPRHVGRQAADWQSPATPPPQWTPSTHAELLEMFLDLMAHNKRLGVKIEISAADPDAALWIEADGILPGVVLFERATNLERALRYQRRKAGKPVPARVDLRTLHRPKPWLRVTPRDKQHAKRLERKRITGSARRARLRAEAVKVQTLDTKRTDSDPVSGFNASQPATEASLPANSGPGQPPAADRTTDRPTASQGHGENMP